MTALAVTIAAAVAALPPLKTPPVDRSGLNLGSGAVGRAQATASRPPSNAWSAEQVQWFPSQSGCFVAWCGADFQDKDPLNLRNASLSVRSTSPVSHGYLTRAVHFY